MRVEKAKKVRGGVVWEMTSEKRVNPRQDAVKSM
jgi:hypothetical protein